MPSDVRRSAVGFQVLEALYPLTSDNDFRRANPLVDIKFDERLRKVRSVYDLNLKDTSGNSINLAAFKGKYLVLDFWTSTCQPCIENIPAIRQIRTRTDSNFIQFIGISLDTEPDYWKSAIKKYGFDLVQLSDLQGFHGITPVFCKVLWVPKFVIVDKEGKIINYNAPQPVNPDFKKLIDRLAQDYFSNNYHR